MNWFGQKVTVSVPATSANLGPGFDCLGLTLGVSDRLTVTATTEPGVRLAVTGCGAGEVPEDESHLVVRAIRRAIDNLGMEQPPGLRLSGHNAIPHGRGLGSSAAAVVAGLAAGSVLGRHLGVIPEAGAGEATPGEPTASQGCQAGFSRSQQAELLRLATEFEGHPDNAAAAIYGGLTVAWTSPTEPHAVDICPHPAVAALLLVPSTRLATSTARAALPSQVSHADAALTAGRAALLMVAMTQNPGLLLDATEERLHQEQRAAAMPQTVELLHALRGRGLAAVVSGAGPSLLVLLDASLLLGLGHQDVLAGQVKSESIVGLDPARGLARTQALVQDIAGPQWQVSCPEVGVPGVAIVGCCGFETGPSSLAETSEEKLGRP